MNDSAGLSRPKDGPSAGDNVGHTRGGLHPSLGLAFRKAFDEAGGMAVLGRPRSDDPSGFVGQWGPGWRQDLRGGAEGDARIMALDATSVVVMSGRWHEDYTDGSGFGPNSGPVLGYPVSTPHEMGPGRVVRLSGGEAGPGLMASDPDGRMRWLRGPVAVAWLQLGGPEGLLGRPVGNLKATLGGDGQVQPFEHDDLLVPADGRSPSPRNASWARMDDAELTEPVRGLLDELQAEIHRFWSEPLLQVRHDTPSAGPSPSWDVFISHASEDKQSVARPLADALRAKGVEVWIDDQELRIGDSLRRKIDAGLANSRFGVVVLSPAFFDKGWTQYELDGLVTRSVGGEQNLLPLWHGITKDELIAHSPSLADKFARSTSSYAISDIADEIAAVVLPGEAAGTHRGIGSNAGEAPRRDRMFPRWNRAYSWAVGGGLVAALGALGAVAEIAGWMDLTPSWPWAQEEVQPTEIVSPNPSSVTAAEATPSSSPEGTPDGPSQAPSAPPAEFQLEAALVRPQDLREGWQEIDSPAEAGNLDDDEFCGHKPVANFDDEARTAFVFGLFQERRIFSVVAHFPPGEAEAFMNNLRTLATSCETWQEAPSADQPDVVFEQRIQEFAELGYSDESFRVVTAGQLGDQFDFVYIRRGDLVASVAYGVIGDDIVTAFTDQIADEVDRRLGNAAL